METPLMLFGYQAITRLTLVILGLTLTFYLWQIKQKSIATWLFFFSFICMTLGFVALFIPLWLHIVEPLQLIFLILSQALLIQFGYYFPIYDQPRESRMTCIISGVFLSGVLGLGGYYTSLFLTSPSAARMLSSIRGILYLLLLLHILLTLGLLFRQTIRRIGTEFSKQGNIPHRIQQAVTGFMHPPEKESRMLRNIVLGLSLGLIPGIAEPLYRTGMISRPTMTYMVDLGLLLMMFIVFVTYLNGTHESVSLTVRLVSVPLVTLLALFGTVGLITANRFNAQSEHERQTQMLLAYKAILDGDFTVLTEQFVYIATQDTTENAQNTPYRVLFVRDTDWGAQFLHDEDSIRQQAPSLFIPEVPVTASDEFRKTTSLQLESLLRFDEKPVMGAAKYFSYRFTYERTIYEIGFAMLEQRLDIHKTAVGFLYLLILGSLFILLVFPRFFKKTLVNPLNALLNGVRQANANSLDVAIPVQYEDEIGFLTHSFNGMLASIRKAEEDLHQVNVDLESRVEQRTAELSQANNSLRQLNASKDKFFSIIAHDLQAPITRVLDLIHFIPENIEHFGPDELKETAETLRGSLENFYDLLKNLFTWSGIQRGTMRYHPQQVNLNSIVSRNLSFFIPLAEEKQVRIKNLVPADTVGYADPDMMYAVVRSLISNAVKFTFPGDKVTISANIHEDEVEIIVADTGVGINKEDLPKLFRGDVVYQTPGTSGEEGSGLGLLLCKELIEQNRGLIWIESEPDKGTTCGFTLPKSLEKMQ